MNNEQNKSFKAPKLKELLDKQKLGTLLSKEVFDSLTVEEQAEYLLYETYVQAPKGRGHAPIAFKGGVIIK